jgi:hypothetical protein
LISSIWPNTKLPCRISSRISINARYWISIIQSNIWQNNLISGRILDIKQGRISGASLLNFVNSWAIQPDIQNVWIRSKMSGSIPKCPDPLLIIRIRSLMSGSVPACLDPFPNGQIRSQMDGSVPYCQDPFQNVWICY